MTIHVFVFECQLCKRKITHKLTEVEFQQRIPRRIRCGSCGTHNTILLNESQQVAEHAEPRRR